MAEAEIGVIRSEIGFDYAVICDTYSFGRSDFKDFCELDNIPQLMVFNREGKDHGFLILLDHDLKDLREERIDDGRSLYYNPQGRLAEIEFRGISKGTIIDERILLPPDELEIVKSLLNAYRIDLEAGKPGKLGFYHLIPLPANPVSQS